MRNLSTGKAVEVQAEGKREQLEKLIGFLIVEAPTDMVEKVVANWSKYTGSYFSFSIRY